MPLRKAFQQRTADFAGYARRGHPRRRISDPRQRASPKPERPRVTIGDVAAPIVIGSDSFVIARVPEGASAGELVIESGKQSSESWTCDIGIQIADSLHPVANPAVDSFGNIYTTFSGSRGQKTPVSVYSIDLNFNLKPFVTDLMNATGLAFDREGMLYVSSRYDGIVYQVDAQRQHVGLRGRHGRRHRHRVRPRRKSVRRRPQRHHFQDQPQPPDLRVRHARAVHRRLSSGVRAAMAICTSPDPPRRASIPSTAFRTTAKWRSSIAAWAGRRAWRSTTKGAVRGGIDCADAAAWCASRPISSAELFLSGPGIVGLAFTPSRAMIVATTNAIYRVDVGIKGWPLAYLDNGR